MWRGLLSKEILDVMMQKAELVDKSSGISHQIIVVGQLVIKPNTRVAVKSKYDS